MSVCKDTLDVDEATAGLITRPGRYLLPNHITQVPMNLATLGLHAMGKVGKHGQLYLRVEGVSSAIKERTFEILVYI